MRKFVSGNLIEDIATFTQDDNVTPVDPTAVNVRYQWTFANTLYGPYTLTYSGASTPAAFVIAKLSAGTYEVQLDTSLFPGYWQWQWNGSGNGQAHLPLSAIVYPAPI